MRKNKSLIAALATILIVGFGGYYFLNLKQSKYPVSTFVSLTYKWGLGNNLVNSYYSATGNYQYLDSRDSLIKTKVKLRANNIIYIHSKANELNLWQLPDVIANPNANLKSDKILRYEMNFVYENQVKKIIYLTDYNEDPTILADISELQKIIKDNIDEVEDRYAKP